MRYGRPGKATLGKLPVTAKTKTISGRQIQSLLVQRYKANRAVLKTGMAKLSFKELVPEAQVRKKEKQGNYSLRRPPKLIIPKIFTKQRWATVYRFMCNRICKSKQAYMTRAKVMSSLRDKINQKLLTFKRTPSP